MFKNLLPLLFLLTACGGDEASKAASPVAPAAVAAPPPIVPPSPAEAAALDKDYAYAVMLASEQAAAADPSEDESCEGFSDYESFVDDYLAAVEEMANGDLSAAAKMASLQGKATKAGSALANLKPGTDCYMRFIAIQTKMTAAAMRIANTSAPQATYQAPSSADMAKMEDAVGKMNDAVGCLQKCQGISDPTQSMKCMQGCQ